MNSVSSDSHPAASGSPEMLDVDSPDANARKQRLKRKRTPIACQNCRSRKSRCNGIRPTCATCDHFGFECIYPSSSSTNVVTVGPEYLDVVEKLTNRVSHLEKMLTDLASRPSQAIGETPQSEQRRDPLPNQSPLQSQATNATVFLTDVVSEASVEDEETVDAMGAVSLSLEEDCAFFGPSSNISFLRHMSRAVARVSSSGSLWIAPRRNEEVSAGDAFATLTRPTVSMAPRSHDRTNDPNNTYGIPPLQLADDLISGYFANTGQLFPFIHQASFKETYGQLRTARNPKVRRSWLALMNMTFAMAATTWPYGNSDAERRLRESEVYFQRATDLCMPQVFLAQSLNVDLVQCLILMSQYLQGTQKSVQTWVIHGLAVKIAFHLGLHSTEASKTFPVIEREVRKRTWFALVLLDRTLSMTFGRPSAIPPNCTKLDAPEAFPGSLPTGEEYDRVEFFRVNIKLYEITNNVLEQLYHHNSGSEKTTVSSMMTVSEVYKLENELITWQKNLPARLKIAKLADFSAHNCESGDDQVWLNTKFRTIITVRYLSLRILLHRPLLVAILEVVGKPAVDESDLQLLRQLWPCSGSICTSTAVELVNIVHGLGMASTPYRRLLGAWWFNLYYAFNAALILQASIFIADRFPLGQDILREDEKNQARRSLQLALEVLPQLDQNNRLVSRCLDCLSQLINTFSSLESGQPPPGHHLSTQRNDDILDPGGFGSLSGLGRQAQGASGLDELGDFLFPNEFQFLSGNFPNLIDEDFLR